MAEKAEKKLTIFGFLKNTYDMGFDLFMSMLPKPMQDWIKSFLKASKSGEKWMGVFLVSKRSFAWRRCSFFFASLRA